MHVDEIAALSDERRLVFSHARIVRCWVNAAAEKRLDQDLTDARALLDELARAGAFSTWF